jgi:hypothetical protein
MALRSLIGTECYCFMDDIICYSATIQEHAERLGHVLHCLQRAKLKLNPEKCLFARLFDTLCLRKGSQPPTR